MTLVKKPISRVSRTKEAARESYNRLSRWYDLIAGSSEWKFVQAGLDLLDASEGEVGLDLGFGTGRSVLAIAEAVGTTGHVYGMDLSEGMYQLALKRVAKAGFVDRVTLRCGDAAKLAFEDEFFDAVFMSFTLELFDTPEIPIVLAGCKRVLKKGGRIAIVSMVKKAEESFAVRSYERVRTWLPNYMDCRPIYVGESVESAGFRILEKGERQMWGLPVAIILAGKSAA